MTNPANTNNNIVTVPNMEIAATMVMEQGRRTIDANYIDYLINDAIEVMAMLADHNRQEYHWTANDGGYLSAAFHCTDTGVYCYMLADTADAARDENPNSVLVIVGHYAEREGWNVTIR